MNELQVTRDQACLVRIEGRVQNVWFRAWTTEQAVSRGLRGWVRNRVDGSVEAMFVGPGDKIDDMIAACWAGPPLAHVARVSHAPAEDAGTCGFRYLPTA